MPLNAQLWLILWVNCVLYYIYNNVLFKQEIILLTVNFKVQSVKWTLRLSKASVDTGKKWTSSNFPGFPILSNVSPIFHNVSLDFSQRFPDFSLTKLFQVRKCERCGSLNTRPVKGQIIWHSRWKLKLSCGKFILRNITYVVSITSYKLYL